MSLYAVVLVCALSSPCSEETSIREIIAPSPAPNEHACFLTADNMRAKTPQFFRGHVMRMLTVQWGGVYRFLERPLGSGKNPYLEAIAENIRKVDPSFHL